MAARQAGCGGAPEGVAAAGCAEVHLIRGGAATGKTQRLAERAAELLGSGGGDDDVLVVCATPDSAALFAERLARACEAACLDTGAADGVKVVSARELELEILAHPAARARTGRAARMLLPFEVSFLLEDLKVGGTPTGRLRGMLKFFYKSMTEMADEADDFLIDADEVDAMERIKTLLAMSGGVLEYELPGLACRCVRDVPAVKEAFARPHVLVDDWQMLCRASQLLCEGVAAASLWVAADPAGCVEVFEPYPYGEGDRELLERHPQATVEELDASYACLGSCAAASALRSDGDVGLSALSPADGSAAARAEAVGCLTPSEELGRVVEVVEEAVGRGVAPEEVFVAVPNRMWKANVCRALGGRGIATLCEGDVRGATGGDIRDLARCGGARMLTLLLLAGDSDDGVAWRSWCGFGDYLANSGIVNALRDLAATRGGSTVDVLEALAAGDDALADAGFPEERRRVVEAYARGRAAIGRLASLSGPNLLRAVAEEVGGEGACVPAALLELCSPVADDSARDLRKRVLRRLALPGLFGAAGVCGAACDADAAPDGVAGACAPAGKGAPVGTGAPGGGRVVVGPASALVGRTPQVVVACGLVNGFLPRHSFFDATRTPPGKIAKARGEFLRRANVLLGKARDRLVCTWFTQVDLETAGRLDLKVDRIWTDGNVRMASVSPSVALEAAGLAGSAPLESAE